jgi:hypothetical protein
MSKNFLRHFPAIGFCFKLSNKVYYSYLLEDVIILELPELEFISNLCFVKILRGNSYKELNITDEEID